MDVSTLLIRAVHDVFGENDSGRRRAAVGQMFHVDESSTIGDNDGEATIEEADTTLTRGNWNTD